MDILGKVVGPLKRGGVLWPAYKPCNSFLISRENPKQNEKYEPNLKNRNL